MVAMALICMTLNCYLWLPEILARADWETPCVATITFSCLRTHLALHRAAADSLEKQVMTLQLYNANLINNNSKRKKIQHLNNWVMIPTQESMRVRLRTVTLVVATYI